MNPGSNGAGLLLAAALLAQAAPAGAQGRAPAQDPRRS